MERIDPGTLQGCLEDSDVVLVDLRSRADWEAGASKIGQARHLDPLKFAEWARDLPRDKKLVLY